MHTELDHGPVVFSGRFGRISGMKKLNPRALEYPVVIRKVLGELVISVPDLGFWKSIVLEEKNEGAKTANSAKLNFDFQLSEDVLKAVGFALEQAWENIDEHLTTKKWVPEPSHFRQTVQKNEGQDFTLPEFTEKLSEYISISENTVRREIKRGTIQCYQTEGGHRRIPFSELELYLKRRNSQKDLKLKDS